MPQLSSSDSSFRKATAEVLARLGEIVALIRFPFAAGDRSYEIFADADAFYRRLAELPERTSVTVFCDRQLPLRGIVDASFVEQVLAEIPNGADWIVARTTQISMGGRSWYHIMESNNHNDLREELLDDFCFGHSVAVGREPDRLTAGRAIAAYVPCADGTVMPGTY